MTAQMDGRAITNPENAQNFSHAEIKQAADRMNPDELDGAFDAWAAIAAAVTKAGQQFETAIQQAVDQHWEGAAADRAVRGIREYAARVGELGESLDQQSTPLSAAASAAGRFKVAVPPVVDTSDNPRGTELRNSQEEQARDDMSTLYIQPYGNTAPSIPTLPPPVDPISVRPGVVPRISPGGTEDSAKAGNPGNAEGTSGSEGTGVAEQTGAAEQTGKAEETGQAEDTGKVEGNGALEGTGRHEAVAPQSIVSTQNNGSSTAPASTAYTSTSSTIPSAVGPPMPPTTSTSAGIAPGISNVAGASTSPGNPPSPGGTPDTGGTPSPGKSVPGTTPGATAAHPATSTPSRVSATGTAGYSGMYPPSARGRRGEDGEHKSATYLRTEEHGEQLIGEVEKTVPPVLGAQ
ncbi:hypothetical protein AB0L63_01765 [Nocardia sp. NPDC051990]|uniref:PPE domain-containing protein n=1 Tax=Nocardia sp. NPDC051990 TaxID=3155285 RepID=UPI00342386FA